MEAEQAVGLGARGGVYGRFSNEDPAKSGLESKRILNVEGGFS